MGGLGWGILGFDIKTKPQTPSGRTMLTLAGITIYILIRTIKALLAIKATD
jgi:hypothetical protein